MIVGVGLVNPVIVHGETVVIHNLFQIGIRELSFVRGHHQSDISAVFQISFQLSPFTVCNVRSRAGNQYKCSIIRYGIQFRQIEYLCLVVIVDQIGSKGGVLIQVLLAVSGQEIYSGGIAFRHALDGSGNQVFALEAFICDVAVRICCGAIHGRAWKAFFVVAAYKDHVTGR